MVADLARFPGSAVYALTKGALASFVRGLAHDLGPRGITVNNLQPGTYRDGDRRHLAL
jgi:3-oxoacyl-[acyl-carrier protein] reductase